MRKKLLALMMCATMVLSTATTAFATPLEDVKKMYDSTVAGSNVKSFMDEFYPTDGYVVDTVYNNGANYDVAGDVTYGYKKPNDETVIYAEYTPVVVYKDKADYKIATPVSAKTLRAYETAGIKMVQNYADFKALTGVDLDKVFVYKKDGTKITSTMMNNNTANMSIYADKDAKELILRVGPNKSVAAQAMTTKTAVNKAITDAQTAGFITADTDVNYMVNVRDLNGGTVLCLVSYSTTNNAWEVKKAGAKYVDGTRLYAQVESYAGSKDDLLKASTSMFTVEGNAKVYTQLATVELNDDQIEALLYAYSKEVISKDAVVVSMKNFTQMEIATEDLGLEEDRKAVIPAKAKKINGTTRLVSGTYELTSDMFSRTSLDSAEAIDVFKMDPFKTTLTDDYETVRGLEKVATVKKDEAVTFDSTASWSDGMFIFDKGDVAELPTEEATTEEATTAEAATTVAAETTTTAQAANEKSPQMGDTTPVAALAVVMMGAVGAMVVASKKRA